MPESELPQGGNNDNPQGGNSQTPPPQQQTPPAAPKSINPDQEARLSKENAAKRVENRELRSKLDEVLEANKKMLEAVETERKARQAAEEKAAKAEQERTRQQLVMEVATAHKLPPEIAKRLQGNTKEELEADAKLVVEALKLPAQGAGSSNQTNINLGTLGDLPTPSRADQLINLVDTGRATENPFRKQ